MSSYTRLENIYANRFANKYEPYIMPRNTGDICKDIKYCFIRNPKTGSTSLNRTLRNYDIDYIQVTTGHGLPNDNGNQVVFIREPVSRFKSAINWMLYGPYSKNTPYLQKFKSFKHMMDVTSLELLKSKVLDNDIVFTPQKNWIYPSTSILCYEKGMDNELSKLTGTEINISNDNKSIVNETYWENSDEILEHIVKHFYQEDIDLYSNKCG